MQLQASSSFQPLPPFPFQSLQRHFQPLPVPRAADDLLVSLECEWTMSIITLTVLSDVITAISIFLAPV